MPVLICFLTLIVLSMTSGISSAFAKSYCYTDKQGVIRISVAKINRNFKPCSKNSTLSSDMKVKVKKMQKKPVRVAASNSKFVTKKIATRKPENIRYYVEKHANSYNVDPNLVNAIITVESAFNFNAVSSKGALGLMQLMPATAKEMAKGKGWEISRDDLLDPETNILLGVRYISELTEKYNDNLELVLAAYHAGMGSVARYNNKVPPFPSTQHYVRAVTCVYYHNVFSRDKSDFCKL